jgi:hypothetical protein
MFVSEAEDAYCCISLERSAEHASGARRLPAIKPNHPWK